MKALGYLLGSRALDAAFDATSSSAARPEPELGPIATTPETAAAWRDWAKGAATDSEWPPLSAGVAARRRAVPASRPRHAGAG